MKPDAGRRKSEIVDLKARTFEFAVRCAKLAEALPRTRTGGVISGQLFRCGASVGSNYRAARRARSRAEFAAKLGIVEEECDETMYWIELTEALGLVKPASLRGLHGEANELLSIIITAIKTTKRERTNE